MIRSGSSGLTSTGETRFSATSHLRSTLTFVNSEFLLSLSRTHRFTGERFDLSGTKSYFQTKERQLESFDFLVALSAVRKPLTQPRLSARTTQFERVDILRFSLCSSTNFFKNLSATFALESIGWRCLPRGAATRCQRAHIVLSNQKTSTGFFRFSCHICPSPQSRVFRIFLAEVALSYERTVP